MHITPVKCLRLEGFVFFFYTIASLPSLHMSPRSLNLQLDGSGWMRLETAHTSTDMQQRRYGQIIVSANQCGQLCFGLITLCTSLRAAYHLHAGMTTSSRLASLAWLDYTVLFFFFFFFNSPGYQKPTTATAKP